MSVISFQIPLPPISLNTSHRNVRFGNRLARIKKKQTLDWENEFKKWLSEYNDLKPSLLKDYDEFRHCFHVEAFYYLNDKEFFTQPRKNKKRISKVSIDLDNMIKCSLDQIFGWLEINDSQVQKVTAEKRPTNDQATMVFQISLSSIPEVFLTQSH